MSKLTGSKKATQFTESVIREMTRLNQLYGGVNLSQGFPDFPAPAAIKDAACAAINGDVHQYAVTRGARPRGGGVLFAPFYENYGPDAILSGAAPRFPTPHPPGPLAPSGSPAADWSF